jgi:signal transduction histidine kinase
VNQLIVRERDPLRLIEQACAMLTEARGYHGAWMALAGPDGRPMHWAEGGWGESFTPLRQVLERGDWPPCRTPAREAPGVLTLAPEQACTACPLWDKYARRSAVVSMVRHADRTFGMLGIAFPGGIAFHEEEKSLIEEVAGDIGFALHSLATEAEGRRMQTSLAQSDRLASMGMLAAGVAHELNNPLAYVLYNLESLSEELPVLIGKLSTARQALAHSPEPFDAATWADVMDRFGDALEGTRKIREIARGLGAFSRVEREGETSVDLRYPIESALSISHNEIKYRAKVHKELGTTARVPGSEGKLSHVFLNLLLNAAHAIHDGQVDKNRILVRTWQQGDTVLAEVQDTGCGIPAEQLDRIFEPFFTTKPVGVGSGLGLSIVRNIIAALGGTIEVRSEVGRGTAFLIRLPAAHAEPRQADDGVRSPGEAGSWWSMMTQASGRCSTGSSRSTRSTKRNRASKPGNVWKRTLIST